MQPTLRELAATHRVAIKRNPGDGSDLGCEVVRGKNGHLSQDGSRLLFVFTDDGRKTLLTPMKKGFSFSAIKPYIKSLRQDGDTEFIAEIDQSGFEKALKVLGVKRLRAAAGVPVTDPVKLEALRARMSVARSRR